MNPANRETVNLKSDPNKPFFSTYARCLIVLNGKLDEFSKFIREYGETPKAEIIKAPKTPYTLEATSKIPSLEEMQNAFLNAPELFRQMSQMLNNYSRELRSVNDQHDRIISEINLAIDSIDKEIDHTKNIVDQNVQNVTRKSDDLSKRFKDMKEQLSILKNIFIKIDEAGYQHNSLIEQVHDHLKESRIKYNNQVIQELKDSMELDLSALVDTKSDFKSRVDSAIETYEKRTNSKVTLTEEAKKIVAKIAKEEKNYELMLRNGLQSAQEKIDNSLKQSLSESRLKLSTAFKDKTVIEKIMPRIPSGAPEPEILTR